jgi:hypothetical protein
MKSLSVTALFLLLNGTVQAQSDDMVRAHEAINFRGEYAMVCGVIASAKYLEDSKGAPTYLNFDKPYPDYDFSAIIYGKNRSNFKLQPETLTGYRACVYGKVRVYKGKAQIELVTQDQFSVNLPK